MTTKRITFLSTLAICLAVFAPPSTARPDDGETIEITGREVPELTPFDQAIVKLMRDREIPGAELAVAMEGRLVLARGYGLADVKKHQLVRPESLFRIASLAKPITAAVILKLVEAGRLHLDDKALDFLEGMKPPRGETMDPRWRRITIRQLLHHTAGFDAEKSLDPMCASRKVASALGIPSPPDQKAIIHFMLGQPLDFDPGAKYAYSNFGYCVLGRIVEKATGTSYENAAKEWVLAPAGIRRMRLGHTRLEDRAPGEVLYYSPLGATKRQSVFDADPQPASLPYGKLFIEAMDSHGGWIASAVDLMLFVTALDGSRKPGLLSPESIRLLESPPAPPLPANPNIYYGLGWNIFANNGRFRWNHCGMLYGSNSMMVRTDGSVCWAVLVNTDIRSGAFFNELEQAIDGAAKQIKRWPSHDLFSSFQMETSFRGSPERRPSG